MNSKAICSRTRLGPIGLLVFLLALPAALSAADDWTFDVGFLDFPTSGTPEAQEHFLRGVAILHSFGYEQAIDEFQKAQEIEPDFVMAYWGEALCYNHIFRPKLDLEKPQEVFERLGATPEERAAKAPTQREKDFLAAVETHFAAGSTEDDSDALRIAYMEAMRTLHETYPEDDEVAAFYAVSLLAAVGPLDDDTFRLAMEAGAIGLDIFQRNPDHPGAAHYIIHAFDDPVHAPLALPAAERFAEIAAAVSHARHMPSHIFIQRGMWERVSRSNDSAYQVARDLWEPGDRVADMTHATDWGQYGDLQREAWASAEARRELMDELVEMSEGLPEYDREFPQNMVSVMWARQVVETEEWEVRPLEPAMKGSEVFAIGLSAVETGKMKLAKQVRKRLANDADEASSYERTVGRAFSHLIGAKIELARKRPSRALPLLDQALALTEDLGPPAGTPDVLKPVLEFYGEALLELERPREAVRKFEEQLLRTPNRRLSLRGLARAHRESGDDAAAAATYERLTAVLDGAEQSAVLREAAEFLATLGK